MKVISLATCLLMSVLPLSEAAVFTISDEDFAPGDWSFQKIHEVGTTSFVSSQVAGGNPGTFQKIRCSLVATAQVQVLATFTAQGFDPSILGSISSLEYSYDRVNFPEASFRDVNDRLAILQDGKIYFRSMGNILTATTSWEHMSATLFASDFDEWGTAAGSPDFSLSGGPISFGYIRGSSTNNSSGIRSTESGTDNWTLKINYAPVPEPGALVFMALFVVTALNRRRPCLRAMS